MEADSQNDLDTRASNVTKKQKLYQKLDKHIGEPTFTNRVEKEIYESALKYFDSTGFSDLMMDTVGFIYEHPSPLKEAKKIYELAFSAHGKPPAHGVIAVKNEIDQVNKRIERIQISIQQWFPILMRLINKRKVHHAFGKYGEPVFHSKHLLKKFYIHSKPEEIPEELLVVPDDDKSKVPYLVDPGATYLEDDYEWYPWETEEDIQRESLKFNDIAGGTSAESLPPVIQADNLSDPNEGNNAVQEVTAPKSSEDT